ncbi:MAG: hypothetical protein SLAVMIC_00137 [uncultured marine phage]|uniref:Uncharacterized protein n=1 Tax=uncultured marine phage TaxID=707152 RepID=A0A8D9CBQ8_9VIRU|nr:MAG: hypothetical protein SLAVMIC_00137 [uncultured marine phage]
MIKVKNVQLDSEAITILNEIVEMDISAVAAFRLMKIIKELDEIVKNRQQSELNLVKRYAVTDEDGNIKVPNDENGNPVQGTFEIAEENSEEFNTQINELLEYENELDFDPVKFEDLGMEKISVKKLMKLDFLFVE